MEKIISEKNIQVNDREFHIIRVESDIDNFNYQILIDELDARVFMREKIIVLDLLKCNDFSIDAIKAVEILNFKFAENRGVFYLLNTNEDVKNIFSFLNKFNNIKFLSINEFIKLMGGKNINIELKFKIFYKKAVIKNYKFNRKKILIGRQNSCDIVLEDESRIISREHAYIEVIQDNVLVVNISKNGTFINDVPIKRTTIRNGTLVRIGGYLIQIDFKL